MVNKPLIKTPTSTEMQAYRAGIRQYAGRMLESAKKGVGSSIHAVMVSDSCGHRCDFCAVHASSMEKGKSITLELLNEAASKLAIFAPTLITGGEPLDHPDIEVIADRLPISIISFTNGFSNVEPERCVGVLNKIGRLLGQISYHANDRYGEEGNTGRLLVLKYMLLTGREFPLKFLVKFGEERKLLLSWLDTLEALVFDEQVQSAIQNQRVLNAVLGLPLVKQTNFQVTPILRGTLDSDLKLISHGGRTITRGLAEIPPADAVHGIMLLPDGRLNPYLFPCRYLVDPKEMAFASICDDKDVIKKRLREMVLAYIGPMANRTDAELDEEVLRHASHLEKIADMVVGLHSLLKTQEVRLKILGIHRELARVLGINFTADEHTIIPDSVCDKLIQEEIEHYNLHGLDYIKPKI
jgi:hypothetical protein